MIRKEGNGLEPVISNPIKCMWKNQFSVPAFEPTCKSALCLNWLRPWFRNRVPMTRPRIANPERVVHWNELVGCVASFFLELLLRYQALANALIETFFLVVLVLRLTMLPSIVRRRKASSSYSDSSYLMLYLLCPRDHLHTALERVVTSTAKLFFFCSFEERGRSTPLCITWMRMPWFAPFIEYG